MTMMAWIAAAMVNPAWADSRRATVIVTASAIASCHQPDPATIAITSATRMPTSMPSTVCSTRRGRASRTRPRLETVTVAAMSGAGCPRR